MELTFYSLSSGSSGNCYYIGNEIHGILIDAGISATSIRRFLKEIDVSLQSVMGILITHNHIDHIRGLGTLTGRNHLPVYTTRDIRNSILSPRTKITRDSFVEISLQEKFCVAGFDIEAFPVHHDAPATIGFQIRSGDKKITIVTDLGHICQTASKYIKEANMLVIESNYDEQMLLDGSYPYFLKNRIRSDHGHLGNHQASSFLAENFNGNMSHICLAHLSKNNNTPEKALQALRQALDKNGIRLNDEQKILVLNRSLPTELITISSRETATD